MMSSSHVDHYILATGAGGYIGSHVVLQLLKSGFNVLAIDNYVNCVKNEELEMPESLSRVKSLIKDEDKNNSTLLTFEEVDCCDEIQVEKLFEKYSDKIICVIHFAGLKAVGESVKHPLLYYKKNVLAALTLLGVMQKYNVSNFIFSSSATVYGTPQYLPLDENHPVGNCSNPYGSTKHVIEQICTDVCQESSVNKLNCISLRYFNPVGSHPSGLMGEDPVGIPNNLMPIIAQVSVGRRPKLSVFGSNYDTKDGTGVRDYIHIMDLADGHVCAVQKLVASNEQTSSKIQFFNLGTGQGYSVLEMIAAYEKASGVQIPFEMVDRRPGDVDSVFAKCDLAKQELNWSAKLSLEDMCRDTWTWQSKNPNGYKSE